LTLVIAGVSALVLFKVYHIALQYTVQKMGYNLEQLKEYEVSPAMRKWDQIIQGLIMIAIVWKVMN
jgi:hypothetical protein